jgi:tellurite resistance protein TerC
MAVRTELWALFGALITVMLVLDLGVFHRRAHEVSVREAFAWSAVWIGLALAFGALLHHVYGPAPALAYLTGYLIEKSLSVDNLFVIVTIFSYFGVPKRYQHRVLFWGILGALVMRGAFIALGTLLIAAAHWVIYVFGALLTLTGVRMAVREETPFDGERNVVVRLVRRVFPVSSEYQGPRFLARVDARWVITPLLLALVLVEVTDLLFALDSIPAIFAVTTDPFLVYTSNIFAILGLRSLYFALAGAVTRLRLLRFGLSAILAFVGIKMLLSEVITIPIGISLGVVGGILLVTTIASVMATRRDARRAG